MRTLWLLFVGITFLDSRFGYGDDLKLVIRERRRASIGLNEADELVAGQGYLITIETDKDRNSLLVVHTKERKNYLSYSSAEKKSPKLTLSRMPEANSRWVLEEYIPRKMLGKDSPAWGATKFLPAGGPFTDRILAAGKDGKLLLLKAEDLTGEFHSVGRDILYDNLNDGK